MMDMLEEFCLRLHTRAIAEHEIEWTWPFAWIDRITSAGILHVALRRIQAMEPPIALLPTAVVVRYR